MGKKTVRYSSLEYGPYVGQSAVVTPIDHPDAMRVSNRRPATTSTVIAVDEATGNFETMNTLYVKEN